MADWRINAHYLEVRNPVDGSWAIFCEAFGVEEIHIDLLSGLRTLKLFVDTASSGKYYTEAPRSRLRRNSIMSPLYDLGLSMLDTDEDIPLVQQVLLESEAAAPVRFVHSQLGFVELDGVTFFLLDEPVGLSDPLKSASQYTLRGPMIPCGAFDDWHAMIEAEVLGYAPLELALAIGAVAPVAHLLHKQRAITELPIIALIGLSSTGKTTAMRLAASIWGLPVEGSGIIDDLHTTENAFFETLAGNVGLPSFIDETSAQPSWDFSRMIYFLPKGRGKRRCSSNGGLHHPKTFTGAVIFTGERSLLEQTEKNTGLQARIIELHLDHWAKDAAHAEQLSEACCQNYGTAAPLLASWLLSNEAALPSIYKTERSNFASLVSAASGVEQRILKIYSMILTAAAILRQALGLDLDLDAIRQLLCDQLVIGRPERDKVALAYETILAEVSKHGSKFLHGKRTDISHPIAADVWGVYGIQKSKPCLWIMAERFNAFLHVAKVFDRNEVLRPFCDRGWLVDFGSRHYFRDHVINGVSAKCCCLLLPDSPSLSERITTLPANASGHKLVTAIHGNSFDATVLSSQSTVDAQLAAAAAEPNKTLVFGLAFPCAQGQAVIINNHLAKALKLSSKAYITVIADDGVLLLSKSPIANTSVKITLSPGPDDCKLNTSISLFNTLLKLSGFDLYTGEGISFFDIHIEPHKGIPMATINFFCDNAISVAHGSINGWELPELALN